MGLLTKLTLTGSPLCISNNGGSVPVNPLSTDQSLLHDEYSITGNNFAIVNSQYQTYIDGTVNLLPQPSQLDVQVPASTYYLNNLPQ